MNTRAFPLISLILAALFSAYLVLPLKPGSGGFSEELEDLSDFYTGTHLRQSYFLGSSVSGRLSAEEKLILFGDRTKEDELAQQKAILDSDPDNPVYYGNYITYAMIYLSTEDALELLARAAEREPDNCRYDWMRAALILDEAAECESPETDEEQTDWLSYFKIKDREKLDQAMVLLRQGAAKPYYHSYMGDMMRERIKVFGEVENFIQAMERTGVSAGSLLPDVSKMRNLAKTSAYYAFLLESEGKNKEAAVYAMLWRDLATKMQEDSFTLIEVLVINAVIGLGGDMAPPLFQKLGQPEKADEVRRMAEEWASPVRDWRENRGNNLDKRLREKGGVLDGLLLSSLGETMPETELTAGRLLDYHLVDSFMIRFLPFLFSCPLLGACLILWRWKAGPGDSENRLKAGENAAVFFLGALTPLAVWRLLTLVDLFGGRNLNLTSSYFRSGGQFLVTAFVMVFTVSALARRFAGARVTGGGVERAPRDCWELAVNKVFWGLLVVAAGLVYFPLVAEGSLVRQTLPCLGICLLQIALVLKFIPAAGTFVRAMKKKETKGYYTAICQSIIPTYAIIILLLAWGPLNPLRKYEKSLVQATSFGQPEINGFTTTEDRLAQRLLNGLRKAGPLTEKPSIGDAD